MVQDDLVTLRYFSSPQQASIYKTLLEDNGIPAFLKGEYVNEVLPIGSVTDIELQILSADEKRAQDILSAEFDKNEFDWESKI